MTTDEQYKLPLYELVRDLPLVKSGTIFYYDKDDVLKGSIANGCLKLAWSKIGGCQHGLCADTIVFHSHAIKDEDWFRKIESKNSVDKDTYVDSGVKFNDEVLYLKTSNAKKNDNGK